MCKSTLNACYSILTYDGEKPKTTQGCIETLEPSQRVVCRSEKPEHYTSKLPTQEQSLLICCDNDMCNYNEKKAISIIVKEKSNGSTQNGKFKFTAFPHIIIGLGLWVKVMDLNATFNNISVISWRSVLLVEETRVPGRNHRSAASH